jgi:hypothetical protein
MLFAVLDLLATETAASSEEQRTPPLLMRSPNCRQVRISAENLDVDG